MAYPEIPSLSYSYTGFQQAQGDNSFPGTRLDNDLAVLKASIASIVAFLQTFAREDGKLSNGSVTKAALDASLLLGVGSPSSWTTGVAYKDGDTVVTTNKLYVAKANHTAGVFATDLAAGKWLLLADFTSFTLADGSVSEPKLAAGSGSSRVLADLGVLTAKIAALAVTEPKLADAAVSTRTVADGALTEAKYANLSVSTVKLQDLAVSSAKLGNGSVTGQKMATIGGQRLLGNNTAFPSSPFEISPNDILNMFSTVQGSLLFRGSSFWGAIAPGPAGSVLKSNGPNADPTFASIPGTGTVTSVTGTGGITGVVTGSGTLALDTVFGNLGTYAMAMYTGSGLVLPGAVVSGGSLRPSPANAADTSNTTLSGTWRCMGLVAAGSGGAVFGAPGAVTLWQRIS